MIDAWRESRGIEWFAFTVKTQVLSTTYAYTRKNWSDSMVATKLGITPGRFEKALYRALNSIGAYIIELTHYPSLKKSYVSAEDRRWGNRPVSYYDGNSYSFSFYMRVKE